MAAVHRFQPELVLKMHGRFDASIRSDGPGSVAISYIGYPTFADAIASFIAHTESLQRADQARENWVQVRIVSEAVAGDAGR